MGTMTIVELFDKNNIFGISEIEMLVWKDNKTAELSEELYNELFKIDIFISSCLFK